MWRWLRGAQAHLSFDDLVINIYRKLDRQWQVYLNNKLAGKEVYTAKHLIEWIEDKNLEQLLQIERLRNYHEVKRQPGEDVVNYVVCPPASSMAGDTCIYPQHIRHNNSGKQ